MEEGGLAWLLGFGLSPAALAAGMVVTCVATDGGETPDATVAHAWRHARQGCRPDDRAPCQPHLHFAPPAAESPDAYALREQVRMAMAAHLRDGFLARLGVRQARPDASHAERWAELRKSMMATYVLGLPMSLELAARIDLVERWSTREVFGCSASWMAGLLKHLQAATLAAVGADARRCGAEPAVVARAAKDFVEYVGECIVNVAGLRREGVVRGDPLPPDIRARVDWYVSNTRIGAPRQLVQPQAVAAFARQASSHSSSLAAGSGRDNR